MYCRKCKTDMEVWLDEDGFECIDPCSNCINTAGLLWDTYKDDFESWINSKIEVLEIKVQNLKKIKDKFDGDTKELEV